MGIKLNRCRSTTHRPLTLCGERERDGPLNELSKLLIVNTFCIAMIFVLSQLTHVR